MATPSRSILSKKIISALALTLATATPFLSASAACDKPVDPTRATIFIDLNFGSMEIQRAEKAACDRGETFIRFPEEIAGEAQAHADLTEQASAKTLLDATAASLTAKGCAIPTAAADAAALVAPSARGFAPAEVLRASDSCTDLQAKYLRTSVRYETATSAVDAFLTRMKEANSDTNYIEKANPKNNGVNFIWGMTARGFKSLAARGIRPSALIVSGHSSGNAFMGRFGGMTFVSLQNHIMNAYASQPELLSDFHAMFLWGCNTLNPYEPEKWLKLFPTLQMIVGFQGSAPSNLNSSSWSILDSLMHRQTAILASLPAITDVEQIRKMISKTDGISGSVAAVYLHDISTERGWFYERVQEADPETKQMRWISRASELLNAKECAPVSDQIAADQAYLETVFQGQTPINRDSGSGLLREAYTRARRNDTCRAALGFKYNADQFGLLLFWHDVKKNAMRFMEKDTAVLTADLAKWSSDKATIDALVAQSNADVRSGKVTRNADLDKKRTAVMAKIAGDKARLAAIDAAKAMMPWTADRVKELKEKSRREQKLIRAVANGEALADSLTQTRAELVVLREAQRIGDASRVAGDSQHPVMGAMKTDEISVAADLSAWEKTLTNVDQQILNAGGAFQVLDSNAVYAQLLAYAKTLTPKSVSEISDMSFMDALTAARARVAAWKDLERSITSSPNLMTTMGSLLTEAKAWGDYYQNIILRAKPECVNMLDWHEYVEGEPVASQPKYECDMHYDH